MSGEGPTTTGSIDAKLTIDSSEFDRKAEEAKATAHELGALSPSVKVDADVAPAIAKLEAVQRAERDLDAAYLRSAISQDRLSAATKKYGDDSQQANVARLAAMKATNAESDAEAKLTGLRGESTQATDNDTEATNRNVSSNNQRVRGLQVLIAMSPAILAAAAPIGAAAVGLGAAFGVMAVSGVLAVKGIKDAMEVGDTVGNAYAAGIAQVKGNLDQLSGTAATRMLDAFNQATESINENMPFLNQMVGNFSAMLGNMGGTVLRGVLTGLEAMNPLLQEGGIQLGNFVGWLSGMTSSNGFTSFVTYAVDNLPSVMHLIEGLVTLAGNILAAFAPLGPVVIGVLSGITDVLNAMPLPILAGLVTAGVSMGPAFAIARTAVSLFGAASATAAGEVTLFGMAANLAIPVVGIITAAVFGIGMAFAASAASNSTATQATQDYTQALKDDNDALGEHTRLQAAKALSDAGAFQAAQTLGISQKTLTDATLGNADAQQEVADKIGYANRQIKEYADSTGGYVDATTQSTGGTMGFADAIAKVNGAMGDQKAAIDRGKQSNQDVAAAMSNQQLAAQALALQYGGTVAGIQSAQQAEEQTATQLAQTTLNMQMQNDAAGILKASLDGLNGKAMSAAQAQNAFDSSLANMGDHVDKTGKKITFTTTSIGDMSAASVALRGQLNGQVSTLQGVVEANGGFANSTGKARDQMVTMRQQIIDNAVAHGVNRDAVTAYIDKILQIPASVPPTKLDIDKAAADAAIEAFKQHLASINSRTVTVTTNYVANGKDTGVANTTNIDSTPGIVQKFAGGGQVADYLAGGGFPGAPHGTDTQAAWLTPGEIVMNTSAVASLGAGNLLAANRTGQWPAQAQQGSAQPVVVNLVLDGQIIDSRTVNLINGAINGAVNDAKYRRVGV